MHILINIITLSLSLFLISAVNCVHQYKYRNCKASRQQQKLTLSANFILFFRTMRDKTVRSCLLGIAWLWMLLLTCVSHTTAFSLNTIHIQVSFVAPFTIIMFAGAVLGWWVCYKQSPNKQAISHLPIGLTLSTLVLLYLTFITHPNSATASIDMQSAHLLHLAIAFFAFSFAGGVYVRPLYFALNSIIQKHSSRYLLFINIWGAVFMLLAAAAAFGCKYYLPINLHVLFLLLTIGNVILGIFVCKMIPHAVMQSFVKGILKACFNVKVNGIENFYNAGDKVLIIANHSSYLDVFLLAAFLPEKLNFAISDEVLRQWWTRPLLKLINTTIINPADPMSAKNIIKLIQDNKPCVMFPEGRVSTTGTLMKIYEAPALIADKSGAVVLPVRIDGMQGSIYSKCMLKNRTWFPNVSLTISETVPFTLDENIKGRQRREILGTKLHNTMTNMMFASSNINRTIFQGLLQARKSHGGNTVIVEDEKRQKLTYNKLILKSYVLLLYPVTK